MTMQVALPPDMVWRSSIAFTVPEQELTIFAETKPSASAINCPASTASPFFTMGFAGLPMCWFTGNTRSPEGRKSSIGLPRESSL